MVLTALILLLVIGYALGVSSGVLRARRQLGERISATARPRGRSILALRLGGYLVVAGAGGLYLWRSNHTPGLASIGMAFYWLFCEAPVWLHNRSIPAPTDLR